MSSLTFGRHLPPNDAFANGTYSELFRLTGEQFTEYYNFVSNQTVGQPLSSLGSDFSLLLHQNPTYMNDIVVALFGAIVLTFIRLALNHLFIPILLRTGLLANKEKDRFAESYYAHIFYSVSFILATAIEQQNDFLSHPERLWTDFDLSGPVPKQVWFLYVLQVSHYLHCMFAILYLNKWSKDSSVLFFHHIVALLLICISYLNRTYRQGILVLYLHDLCDVIMEGCKCVIKLQITNRVVIKLVDIARVVCFGLFTFFWFLFRLYFFPLKVLYPSVLYLCNNPVNSWLPLSFLLYCLLWFIFIMNLYWATLIVKLLINAFRGKQIDDIREVDDEEELGADDQNDKKNV